MIQPGQEFPAFNLKDQDGKSHRLTDYAGKWVVVYVYPKDDTPGCTLEGKNFTAAKAQYDAEQTVVFGLSEDDVASHKSFCDKFGFRIPLLADPQAQLLNALGVPRSDYKGTMYWNRTTFVIDPTGKTRKVYEGVKVDGHEKAVLEDIRALKRG
jgi:thioredoxin-dependent peroxiredoxin